MRITRTVGTGVQGNARPLKYVEEKWIFNEFPIIVLDIQNDPRFGRSTYELTTFTATEPDPSLFQLPADYKLEERTLR
jgi:hypothetical protein